MKASRKVPSLTFSSWGFNDCAGGNRLRYEVRGETTLAFLTAWMRLVVLWETVNACPYQAGPPLGVRASLRANSTFLRRNFRSCHDGRHRPGPVQRHGRDLRQCRARRRGAYRKPRYRCPPRYPGGFQWSLPRGFPANRSLRRVPDEGW